MLCGSEQRDVCTVAPFAAETHWWFFPLPILDVCRTCFMNGKSFPVGISTHQASSSAVVLPHYRLNILVGIFRRICFADRNAFRLLPYLATDKLCN